MKNIFTCCQKIGKFLWNHLNIPDLSPWSLLRTKSMFNSQEFNTTDDIYFIITYEKINIDINRSPRIEPCGILHKKYLLALSVKLLLCIFYCLKSTTTISGWKRKAAFGTKGWTCTSFRFPYVNINNVACWVVC